MDEFDIKVLQANGYNYADGGIVDAEGNYIPAVELNGKTYNSEVDGDLWATAQKPQYNEKASPDPFDDDLILDNMRLYNNYEKVGSANTIKKETLKTTNTITVNDGVKSSFKEVYKYPIVLGASIIIYLIIKRLIK